MAYCVAYVRPGVFTSPETQFYAEFDVALKCPYTNIYHKLIVIIPIKYKYPAQAPSLILGRGQFHRPCLADYYIIIEENIAKLSRKLRIDGERESQNAKVLVSKNMTTLLIQPTFLEVIEDVRNGVVKEEIFYINFVPIDQVEDGKSHEEWVKVRLDGDLLEFISLSNKLGFKITGEHHYEISFEGKKYKVISPKKHIATGIEEPTSFDISPDKNLFSIGDSKGRLSIGSANNGRVTTLIDNAHFSSITKALFFPSGKVCLTSGLDLQIKIWDVADGSNARTFTGHKQRITDLAMIDRGRIFISSGQDGLLKLWDCSSSQNISTLQRSNSVRDGINVIELSTERSGANSSDSNSKLGTSGKCLYAGHNSGVITQFDLDSNKDTLNFTSLLGSVTALKQQTETTLISAYDNGIIASWDRRNPKGPIKKININNEINSLVSLTNNDILACLESGIIHQYNRSLTEDDFNVFGGTEGTSEMLVSRGLNAFTLGSNGIIYQIK